jgi:hypothetical protein
MAVMTVMTVAMPAEQRNSLLKDQPLSRAAVVKVEATA